MEKFRMLFNEADFGVVLAINRYLKLVSIIQRF